MARETWVYCPVRCAVVLKGEELAVATSRGPQIVRDMAETVHPIDGRTYSSRRHYNDVTRAHGAIEVGKREMANLVARGPRTDRRDPVSVSLREAMQRAG